MIERTESQYEKYINKRFILNEELLQIIDIMKKCVNYRILILGAPGSGKSTLLRQLSQYTTSEKFIEIELCAERG